MQKYKILVIIFMVFISSNVFAQTMPPAPLNSPILNSMEGMWVSDQYEFMGMKMSDEVTQKMVLNGQFLEVDVKTIAEGGFVYEAKVFITQKPDGTFEGWSYDIFGLDGITTYTGTTEGNKLFITGESSEMSEMRNISVDGNIMIQLVSYKFKSKDGSEAPEQTFTVTYNKK